MRNSGLLEHNLREPDGVRVGDRSRRAVLRPNMPRQAAAMGIVMREEGGLHFGNVFGRFHYGSG